MLDDRKWVVFTIPTISKEQNCNLKIASGQALQGIHGNLNDVACSSCIVIDYEIILHEQQDMILNICEEKFDYYESFDCSQFDNECEKYIVHLDYFVSILGTYLIYCHV